MRAWLRAPDGALHALNVETLLGDDAAPLDATTAAASLADDDAASMPAPAFRVTYESAAAGLYAIVVKLVVDDIDVHRRRQRRRDSAQSGAENDGAEQSHKDDEGDDHGEHVSGSPFVVRVRSDRALPAAVAAAAVDFDDLLLQRGAAPRASTPLSDDALRIDVDRLVAVRLCAALSRRF